MGRFLQTDPIGIADGANVYDYTGGDPVNGVDPSGLGPRPAYCFYTTYIRQAVPVPSGQGANEAFISHDIVSYDWQCYNYGHDSPATSAGPSVVPLDGGEVVITARRHKSRSHNEKEKPKYCRSIGYQIGSAADSAGLYSLQVPSAFASLGGADFPFALAGYELGGAIRNIGIVFKAAGGAPIETADIIANFLPTSKSVIGKLLVDGSLSALNSPDACE